MLGDKLKCALNQGKMTYDYVAKEVGVTRQAVERWVNGKSLPRTEYLLKLPGVLGVPVEWLCGTEKLVLKKFAIYKTTEWEGGCLTYEVLKHGISIFEGIPHNTNYRTCDAYDTKEEAERVVTEMQKQDDYYYGGDVTIGYRIEAVEIEVE